MSIDVYKQWLGIPEEFRPPTHYQLLRLVDFEDDPEKIRAHYKKLNGLVRKYATGDYMIQSQELLNELAKAMLCLTDPGRKRDYDESLGREFADDADGGRKPMLRVLAGWGELEKSQIREVEEFADRRGLTHRDAVVQMKLVEPDKAAQALAEELGRSFVDLDEVPPDDRVLDLVPKKVVKRNGILPLFIDEDVVLVACTDEPDHELEDEFRLRFDKPMRAVIATPLQINQGIARHYAAGERDEAAAESFGAGGSSSGKKSKKSGGEKKKESAKPAKDLSKMTEQEKKEHRLMGVIIFCWTFIGSALIDQFVIKPYIFPTWSFFVGVILVVPPVVFIMMYDSYFKGFFKK
ncbi:MAG: hypothetical protein ACE37I_09755 [Rubinisphaera brasiliensis]|uniref:General secretory system II protein E domain protein n=1 Tax=Rubinisphaera brasiliensis (strain ATCC 49424 / DSM 5305 / JCM 21570 / IAM 15109 / NBRC 103401 / IFAM 1448) TaxID=756272 RepID=F0SN30_RUBBR|nr:general secretion pathway protein GspE [Rubinisphaera brasiliensis]ADY61059.1 General secretory system II protein E domain protein [Rubinisphaera brasiliensis DSM 5305]MBB01976.1 general secretion pathway protein GspE [Planctomyces sp.]